MILKFKKYSIGLLLTLIIAVLSMGLSKFIPGDIIGSSVLALILGMIFHPILEKVPQTSEGVKFVSSKVLKLGIILMGITLSFSQVLMVGKYALALMFFTLLTAFGGGYIFGKIFKVNWKLSSLLSVSTAICGGTAVATVGPVIEADDRDIAYAISATFIFDILTVILFPWIGRMIGLSDTSYGLWVGTAVNDTSSVVAAGYGFSEIAGSFAVIVKLTRTLFIVPIVLIFSYIHTRNKLKTMKISQSNNKVNILKIFPWFILMFIVMVTVKSTGLVPENIVTAISFSSKLFMVMALSAIGLKTSISEVKGVGWKPMLLGVCIDNSVVIVALVVQALLQKLY